MNLLNGAGVARRGVGDLVGIEFDFAGQHHFFMEQPGADPRQGNAELTAYFGGQLHDVFLGMLGVFVVAVLIVSGMCLVGLTVLRFFGMVVPVVRLRVGAACEDEDQRSESGGTEARMSVLVFERCQCILIHDFVRRLKFSFAWFGRDG